MSAASAPDTLRARAEFRVSPRFEIFYALETLAQEGSSAHDAWSRSIRDELSPKLTREIGILGIPSSLWPVVGDALLDAPLDLDGNGLASALDQLDAENLQRAMLSGAVHDPALVDELVAKKTTLKKAIERAGRKKQEWLPYVGLYPYVAKSPTAVSFELLLKEPDVFRSRLAAVVRGFWTEGFEETWQDLSARLAASAAEKERLWLACEPEEFGRIALLRAEFNDAARTLSAVQGGFSLPYQAISRLCFLPSAFNTRRLWTAYEDKTGRFASVYFPYFDPSIAVRDTAMPAVSARARLAADPALLLRALADPTRYAIIRQLAGAPAIAADLADELSLSRATVSHHMSLLREAHLIDEVPQGKQVLVRLNVAAIEALSTTILNDLRAPRKRNHR